MKRTLSIVMIIVCLSMNARADEGMWMVNAISQSLVQKMHARGLELQGGEIYSSETTSLADAIVSLDFGCTGSMVSWNGLLITNHHCAYHDVHSLSTPDRDYLEEGFNAVTRADEKYIPGKKAYFLKRVIDVTDEVNALVGQLKAEGKPYGSRRISHLMEQRYAGEGLEASLSSMWAGSKYYMALYKVYTDVRLVVAPPVSIAAFGGDEDNWEWPQHKCDFALYRIYAGPDGEPAEYSEDNVPFRPDCRLNISEEGYRSGDFTMILGYPGRTDRYSSSAKVDYRQTLALPISNEARAGQMRIMMSWMDRDPAVRLKYSDKYFSLSNVQELQEGEVQCYGRFGVVKEKKRAERKLRGKANRQLLKSLDAKYTAMRDAQKNTTWYRETLIRGTALAMVATKLNNRGARIDVGEEYAKLDMRVEKDLFSYAVQAYYEHVDSSFWGPFQKELLARHGSPAAVCEAIWTDEPMTKEMDIFKFFTDVSIRSFNSAVDKAQGEPNVTELGREYTRAMYQRRQKAGDIQYPDANSTMRLSYGRVGSFMRDGAMLPWQTYSQQILAKEDRTRHDFSLDATWRMLLSTRGGTGLPVNFITDNDITGGNSGSPVLNSRGEIIGLAFDGNKESLASDSSYTPDFNRCVCVDIRFVLYTLEKYLHREDLAADLLSR